jgi:hypothetical protein
MSCGSETYVDFTETLYNLILSDPEHTTEYYIQNTNFTMKSFESLIKKMNDHPNTFYPYKKILNINNTWVIDETQSKLILQQKIIELEYTIETMRTKTEQTLMHDNDRNVEK